MVPVGDFLDWLGKYSHPIRRPSLRPSLVHWLPSRLVPLEHVMPCKAGNPPQKKGKLILEPPGVSGTSCFFKEGVRVTSMFLSYRSF